MKIFITLATITKHLQNLTKKKYKLENNMKKIILDGNLMKNNPHDYIKDNLNFPEYYGKNLDALFDCLGDIGEKTEIILINPKIVDKIMINTFKDASKDNPSLLFKIS